MSPQEAASTSSENLNPNKRKGRYIKLYQNPKRRLRTTAGPAPEPEFSKPTELVTFRVGRGNDREDFSVHKEFACQGSPVLKAAFNSPFIEGITQTYELDDVRPAVFRMCVTWIYRQKVNIHSRLADENCRLADEPHAFDEAELGEMIFDLDRDSILAGVVTDEIMTMGKYDLMGDGPLAEAARAMRLHPKGRIMGKGAEQIENTQAEAEDIDDDGYDEEGFVKPDAAEAEQDLNLIQLWLLADRLLMPDLQKEVIRKLRMMGEDYWSTHWINHMWENTLPESPLREFAVDLCLQSMPRRYIGMHPEQFPKELLVEMLMYESKKFFRMYGVDIAPV
ncbi:uncharacterized protein RSE6_06830 [Rhynchosporium secalis]|uniref:BTB domain-containing protein n=1 Tax=Rhynchosporium secalis TaxID=38038 RepID=A0A1E1MBB5_RHYSE|nr:uncharacterized protein RSE6_06830 [Rhynchosporium secalis]